MLGLFFWSRVHAPLLRHFDTVCCGQDAEEEEQEQSVRGGKKRKRGKNGKKAKRGGKKAKRGGIFVEEIDAD